MKTIAGTFTILIFFISSYGQFSLCKDKDKIFRGRVIYITDDYIEIKRGKTEKIIYFTDKTRFIKRNKTEDGRDIIEICQVVKAHYMLESNKNILNKIHILKESNCYR